MQDQLVSYFWSGDAIRSRSVSDIVLSGTVHVPAPPARLLADWKEETLLRLGLEPGDVEPLPLARARMRWPDYKHCVQAMADWTRTLGLHGLLESSDIALMACRGARYHHDGLQYGDHAFCNLFLSEDQGLDLHFPSAGHRIPLTRGTAVIFDTGQPHAVIARNSNRFNEVDFPPEPDRMQFFLSWELPIEYAQVGHALQLVFDVDPLAASLVHEQQVRVNGAQARLCPDEGHWCQLD